jgi:cytochrome P450
MSCDPDIYRDPEKFDPERFLGSDPELDPKLYVFGFGRRLCPGKLPVTSLWESTLMCMNLLFSLVCVQDGRSRKTAFS